MVVGKDVCSLRCHMLATTNPLKTKLAALQYDTVDIVAVVAKAIAPVAFTRLADNLNIQYGEAL